MSAAFESRVAAVWSGFDEIRVRHPIACTTQVYSFWVYRVFVDGRVVYRFTEPSTDGFGRGVNYSMPHLHVEAFCRTNPGYLGLMGFGPEDRTMFEERAKDRLGHAVPFYLLGPDHVLRVVEREEQFPMGIRLRRPDPRIRKKEKDGAEGPTRGLPRQTPFSSVELAAKAGFHYLIDKYSYELKKQEYGFWVYGKEGEYFFLDPETSGESAFAAIRLPLDVPRDLLQALCHNHPERTVLGFSRDIDRPAFEHVTGLLNRAIPFYLLTPLNYNQYDLRVANTIGECDRGDTRSF